MDDNQPHRPEVPDLPETEINDDAPRKAPRKLVLSREVRGWMAVFAAVAVAAAAVAPTIDFADLRGTVSIGDAGSVPVATGGNDCDDEDQSSGFGGQSVGCKFDCPGQAGTISIRVDADDNGAQVSGSASCDGGGKVHCSGKNTCEGTSAREGGGQGSCSADSDEAVDSGLYVECSAQVTGTGTIGHDPPSEVCPVTEPAQVCIQPVCYQFDLMRQDTCQQVWQKIAPLLTQTSNVVAALISDGVGAGLFCTGFICIPAVPECLVVGKARTCAL